MQTSAREPAAPRRTTATVPGRAVPEHGGQADPARQLLRALGNQAAAGLMGESRLHRCGPEPCECSPERQLAATAYAGMPVSHPSDPAERDADQMADQVLRMRDDELATPEPHHPAGTGTVYRSVATGAEAPAAEPAVPMRGASDSAAVPGAVAAGPAAPVGDAFVGGRPLDSVARAWFEPRFGVSLGGVRVHTGRAAADAAHRLNAKAFTVGADIAFGAGQYAPETEAGRRLIAHELAHAVHPAGAGVYRQPADTFHDVDKGPVRPRSKSYYFQGVEMTTDPDYARRQLKLLVRRTGIQGLELWHAVLHGTRTQVPLPFSATARAFGGLRVENPLTFQRAHADDAVRDEISAQAVAVVDSVYPGVLAEAQAFRESFGTSLRRSLERMLRESELRIQTQRELYGLRKDPAHPGVMVAANTVAFRAVVGAAKDLLAIRQRIERLRAELLTSTRPKVKELNQQTRELEKTYDQARISAAARHPALGAILDDAGPGGASAALTSLAAGDRRGAVNRFLPAHNTVAALAGILDSRQQSIDTVRADVGGNPELVWTLPEVVSLTRVERDTSGNIMADAIIDEKLKNIAFEESIKSSFLMVAQLALLIPTGGLSIVGSAALSTYQAMRSLESYRFQSALASTDLDKRAYAIAAEDPSLFWLALDVTFAVVDGTAALKVFRELRPFARAALIGEDVEAAAKLADKADLLGKPGLGKRLLDRLAVLRRRPAATRLLGMAGEAEVKAVAEAAETIGKEAGGAERIAAVAGHEVKVTKSGLLVMCSECTWLRERFARELAENPALAARTAAAEARAASGTLDAAGRAEVGALTAELQRVREARLVAEVGPAAAKAAAAGDARAAYQSVLAGRPVLDRELSQLEQTLASARRLNPADAARLDELTARLSRLREIDAASIAPRNARIVEVSLDKAAANYYARVSQTVPGPPIVLEFPDGSRVWRDAVDGPIRHEATLGGSLGRAGMERGMYSAGAHGNLPAGPTYERAHTVGQGTGFESPYGIFYAPEHVNQTLQNQGIETYLRDVAAGSRQGETFRVTTTTRPHPGTLRLATIDYSLVVVNQAGRAEEVATYSIVVSRSAEHPVVTASSLQFAPTATGRAMATRFPIPPHLRRPARFAY